MTELIERGAKAMQEKRGQLIHMPLERIWRDLMIAALEEMRRPDESMLVEGQLALENKLFKDGLLADDAAESAWISMVDDALRGGS